MDEAINDIYKDFLNGAISKRDLIALIGLEAYNNINPAEFF